MPPARIDEARAALERDGARVRELRAQLRIAQLGSRSDEIEAAEQDFKAAQAQLDQKIQLLAGQRATAVVHFKWSKEKGEKSFTEYVLAGAELKRLATVSATGPKRPVRKH